MAGADAQETKLQVNGAAEVSTDGNCNYVLRLPKFSVIGPDGKRSAELSELLLAKPVRFVLAADQLQPEVCTEQDESSFGLNVKRAIISLLQSNVDSDAQTESDVFGLCKTTTSAITNGDSVQVTRSRDLSACINRESFHTGLVTSIADQSAGLTTTPLLSGDASNEQTIKAGIVEKAQLTENYKFEPFSMGEAGVRAKVITKITLKSKAAGTIEAPKATVSRQLTFENPNVIPQKKAIDASLKSALVAAVDQLQGAVGSTAAGKFTDLVHVLRTVSKEDLLVLYKGADSATVHPNKQLARSVFLDALFRTGTSESVETVAGLLKELNEHEKKLAYISFNLVENVEKDALASIAKLIDDKAPNDAFLSIGNLIHKYVRGHPSESESPAIKSILKKFTSKLGPDCKQDAKRENTIVAVLKGLRNTQHLINADTTISCTSAHQTKRVRVAALQTLTAAACNLKVQQNALQLLQNQELDSELRIEAYLTLVSCPSATVANEVKSLLDAETSLQVGSFITTHLAALRSSTDPYRETARQHFANVRTTKRFKNDIRQYSFNHEYSYSLGSLGVGASADARLIYSQDDFVPRSGRLNITGQLFGESFNVIDISARQENIDLLLEHNFGPKGLFNRLSRQELYDLFSEADKPAAKPNRRGRRGLRPDVEELKKEERTGLNDIELDVSVKLFGNELYFLSLSDKLPLNPKEFVKKFKEHFEKFVSSAQKFQETFEHRSLFLDAELVYPTGVGFPLRLVAHGSGGIRLEVAGQVNLKAIAKNPKALQFTVKTVPSYNMEVSGTLEVDGFAVSSGFAVTGSVHSSTGAEVDFKLIDPNVGFETKVRFPLKKQQLFSFTHDIVTVTQERGHSSFTAPLKFKSKDQNFTGCFDQLNAIAGVTLCSDISFTMPGTPNTALFPLNGPNHGSVSIDIEPEYMLSGRYNVNNGEHTVSVEFDTPGSANSRKITVALTGAISPKIFAKLSVEHEKFKAQAKAGLIQEENELAAYAEYDSPKRTFLAKLGFTKAGSGKHVVYTPIAVYKLDSKTEDNINGWKVTGTVTADKPKENHVIYKFNDVKLIGPHMEPVAVNGQAEHDTGRFSTDLTVSQGSMSGNFKGAIRPDPNNFQLEAALTNNVNDYVNGKFALEYERSDSHVSLKYTSKYKLK